jgi:hypothetical protein
MSAFSDVVVELRRGSHWRTDLRPLRMGSAGPVRTRVPGRALVASSSERGAVERYRLTGAEWEALEAAGWEFLVEHAAGNDANYRPA